MRHAVRIILVGCMVGVIALGGAAFIAMKRGERLDYLKRIVPAQDFRAARATYPFSVIPGGIRDSRELAESIQHDPVVRKHYEDIQAGNFWATRTSEPMLAYVSYRVGDKVLWTNHKINIPKGDVVLTDGKNILRGRCGNRIATKAMTESSPTYSRVPTLTSTAKPENPVLGTKTTATDPPEIVFDTPTPPLMASIPPRTILTSPLGPVLGAPPSVWPPAIPNPSWCCTQSVSPPKQPIIPDNPDDPDNPKVPEPGSLVLVLSGAAAAFTAFKLRWGN